MVDRNDVVIVIPGDDPPQLQGSPHLERLRRYGEVRLHTDRPATAEEKLARARDAVWLGWQTAKSNDRAQRVYERVGAERSEWIDYGLRP